MSRIGQLRTKGSRSSVALLSALAVVVGATWGVQASVGPNAGQIAAERAVKTTVASFEDLYIAEPYPLPSAPTSPSHEFNSTATPHAWIDPATKKAYIPASVIASSLQRLHVLFDRLASPTVIRYQLKLAAGALGQDSVGNYVAGSGGATVLKYNSVVVDGSEASVQAVVSQWSTQGWINSTTGKITWTHATDEALVTDTLSRSSDGLWLITSRQWQFMPGYAP